jgi:diguanylate cyclase (GGDEF)-like protein
MSHDAPAFSTPQRILVIGAGRGGTALMELFDGDPLIEIVGVMDLDPDAPAMRLAAQRGMACFTDLEQALAACQPCLAFNLTGDPSVSTVAQAYLGESHVIGGFQAQFLWTLLTRLKQTQDQIAHLAYHDALTGLSNRTLFYDRLGQALARARRARQSLAVLYLDLDGFKSVNDTFGHDMGDALLVEAAKRIRSCVREADTVARMGGDEFTVILSDLKSQSHVQRVVQCLLRALAAPLVLQTRSCQVGVSIGVAFFPDHGQTAEQLIKAADAAMYWAKQNGKNGYRVFGQ